MIIALAAALNKANAVPEIELGATRALKQSLKRYKNKHGMLLTGKLTPTLREQVRASLSTLPTDLVHKGDLKPLVIDSGASNNATGDKSDFVPGTLKPMDHDYLLEGIGSTLNATHKGTV